MTNLMFYPNLGLLEDGSKYQRLLPFNWQCYGYKLELLKSRTAKRQVNVYDKNGKPKKEYRWTSLYSITLYDSKGMEKEVIEANIIANHSKSTKGAAYRIANDVHNPLVLSFDD